MRPIEAALDYARRGWPVFPCHWQGERRKRPLTLNGFHDAAADSAILAKWWGRWPSALIGLPTGQKSGLVALDIDVKGDRSGFASVDELGVPSLPDTPMAHTPSGGLHLYFARPVGGIPSTSGARGRGIGPGLDWRGEGGYVIAPSPGSGYVWDPCLNLDTAALQPVPAALLPREPPRPSSTARPIRPFGELTPYAEAALDSAFDAIADAPDGQQRNTLNREAFGIGQLVGAGVLPAPLALESLRCAATKMRSFDPRRPWRARDLERMVRDAFTDGMAKPRRPESRHL
jgi:hypothetical protein